MSPIPQSSDVTSRWQLQHWPPGCKSKTTYGETAKRTSGTVRCEKQFMASTHMELMRVYHTSFSEPERDLTWGIMIYTGITKN